jgi:hypothetical protein
MKIKLKIQSYIDREKIVMALANSGYDVHVEYEEVSCHVTGNYFVIFWYDNDQEKPDEK